MRHRHLAPLAAALALIAVLAAPLTASAKVRTGPAGDAFYTPPSPLPGKKHGDLIWARNAPAGVRLKNAKSDKLVLYRSTGSDGKPIAVSGVVSIPKKKAPKGGWPVITWAHGTSGIADSCAPSKADGTNVVTAYTSYVAPQLNDWLKRGYVVVRTDYQGLGTPGVHEYLGGVSEGRSTLDIVRAVRRLDARVSDRFAIAGHSQGGHAAIWAASQAPKYTRELDLRGTLAIAPASHIAEQGASVSLLTAPTPGLGGLIAMIFAGVDAQHPDLNLTSLLSDRARALFPQTDEICLGALGQPDSFGGLAPAEIFRSGADLSPVIAAIEKSDPENLKLGRAPLLIQQGGGDTTVPPSWTEQLAAKLEDRGAKVTYRLYVGANHVNIVTAAGDRDATAFLVKRLR